MAAQTFVEWIRRLRPSFNGNVYKAMMGVAGSVIGDKTNTETNRSLVMELPLYSDDADAVALSLSERGIEPGPTLSLADRQALADAGIALNRFRGRATGLLTALYYAEFPGALMVQQNGLAFQITAAPSLSALRYYAAPGPPGLPSWITMTTLPDANPLLPASTDGRPSVPSLTVPWFTFDDGMDAAGNQFTSRFAIIFETPGTGSGDLTVAANLARIRRVIKGWRDGKATCVGIYVLNSGHFWGQLGLEWGAFNYGGSVTFYAAE